MVDIIIVVCLKLGRESVRLMRLPLLLLLLFIVHRGVQCSLEVREQLGGHWDLVGEEVSRILYIQS